MNVYEVWLRVVMPVTGADVQMGFSFVFRHWSPLKINFGSYESTTLLDFNIDSVGPARQLKFGLPQQIAQWNPAINVTNYNGLRYSDVYLGPTENGRIDPLKFKELTSSWVMPYRNPQENLGIYVTAMNTFATGFVEWICETRSLSHAAVYISHQKLGCLGCDCCTSYQGKDPYPQQLQPAPALPQQAAPFPQQAG